MLTIQIVFAVIVYCRPAYWRHANRGCVMAGKRVNDRLDINASIHYHDRDGKSGPVIVPGISADVFDQQGWTLGLNGNYLLTSSWLLSAGYKYYNGDMDSSCTPGNVGKVFEKATVNAITLENKIIS